MKKQLCSFCMLLCLQSFSQRAVSEKKDNTSFPVVNTHTASTLITDENDDWLVNKAASLFQSDIESITGKKPVVQHTPVNAGKN